MTAQNDTIGSIHRRPILYARQPAAVLFDMDGTLVDSDAAVDRGWLRWAAEYGVDRATAERGVIHGLKAGWTSISLRPDGPFVELTASIASKRGYGGDEVIARAGSVGHLTIHVKRAKSMQVLVYRKPGRSAGVFREFSPASDDETFTAQIEAVAQPDWYRVEVRGLGFPVSAAQPTPAASARYVAWRHDSRTLSAGVLARRWRTSRRAAMARGTSTR